MLTSVPLALSSRPPMLEFFHRAHNVPLKPELAMSIFAYDPFGTGPTCFCMLFLCQMGHK